MSETMTCPFCGGSGGADESSLPCSACNGQGVIVVGPPPPAAGVEPGRFVWALTETGCRRLRLNDDNTIDDGPPWRLEDVVFCEGGCDNLDHQHRTERATPRGTELNLEAELPPSTPEGVLPFWDPRTGGVSATRLDI